MTFAAVPSADDPGLGLVADHAYWVSEIRLARTGVPLGRLPAIGGLLSPPAKGVVDAFSHGFGVGDPPSARGAGTGFRPLPYVEISRAWGARPAIPRANTLDVTLRNVASARVDLARAHLDPDRSITLHLTADTAGTLHLGSKIVTFSPGRHSFVIAP